MITFAIASLALLPCAHAWGAMGHQTVGYIAQHYVKSTTASWAQGLLGDTSDSYLANVATWADSYRATTAGKWSAPFHFIDAEDNPPSTCNVDYNRDCGSSGCSVSAIANYTQRLGDGRLTKAHQAEALKFLVHFLGDVTQPLHDEAYKTGGNEIKVTFDGYTNDNLHSIWDTYMPDKRVGGDSISDAKVWAANISIQIDRGIYTSQSASWTSGDNINSVISTATRWASDANTFVCSKVMPNGAAALQQGDLYPQYYNSVIDTIELQIAKGGFRLAHWLDMIADANAKRKREPLSERIRREAILDENIDGSLFLPAAREPSRAQLARMAVGWDCGHQH